MSVNVLPDMDEPRLKALGKQLNRSRKASIINTDKLKDRFDVYVKSLNKAQKSLDGKYNIRSTRLKKNLARVRGTQKVLKARREQSFWEDSEEYPYGVYEGEKLDSLRREVDNVIERKHPKYRRQRKVEQHLRNGKAMGKILDDEDAKMHFNEIMTKDRKSQSLQRENPLTRTFFHRAVPNRIEAFLGSIHGTKTTKHERDTDERWKEKNDTKRQTSDRKREMVHNNHAGQMKTENRSRRGESPADSGLCTPSEFSEEDVFTVESSPAKLNLPPITAKKDFVSSKPNKEQSSFTRLPDLRIRRATKGDITAVNKERTKINRLRERRATTIIF